jgi:replication factor C subunit 2/4
VSLGRASHRSKIQKALESLIRTADGDLRRAITYLQSACRLHFLDRITPRSVQEIGGVVPDDVMDALGRALGIHRSGTETDIAMAGATDFDAVQRAVEKVVRDGYSAVQILSQVRNRASCGQVSTSKRHLFQLHDLVIFDPDLSSRTKSIVAIALGEADKFLADGADEELQLLSTACKIRAAVGKG